MARILIIDDDLQIREMMEQMLQKEGYETISASDGQIAMKICWKNPADIVITDIIMPEKEGIETIVELKREFPGIKIIAMSGGGRIGPEHYLKMAKGLGASRTFTKPVKREDILKAIKELLT